ncbi:MAG: DUF1080 domain-containing protein [Gemmatimonadaceae bacterium]
MRTRNIRLAFAAVLSTAFCLPAVAQNQPAASNTARQILSLVADGVAQGEWKSLFDGTTMDQWRGYKSDSVPAGWHVADGMIVKERGVGDLMTKQEFGNFELELEWKIGKAGNSGVFYRGTTEYSHIYWSAPEYQLEDNVNADDNKTELNRSGADYALYPAPDGHVKPYDEWNSTRIIVNGNHVEHWLNGFKLLEYEFNSADWKARVAASKFKDWPNYGLAKKGYIAIQGDHPGTLALRNIRIRELP